MSLKYNLAEATKARNILETGVAYGWPSLSFLLSLENRNVGRLVSLDMPFFGVEDEAEVGCAVPEKLKSRWSLISLPDKDGLPKVISIAKDSHNIAFEAYEFTKDGKNLHVFRCFWSSKALPNSPIRFPSGGYSLDGRIQSTLEGRRNVGGTMLALALANVDSQQTAINKLQALANQCLSLGKEPHP